MLRSFRLDNHRSFRDEQELLLMPAMPGDERPAVPVAAIYGANASGKSNLIDGLALMQSLILERPWAISAIGFELSPHRLGASPRSESTTFVIEVIVDDVPYTYGFTLRASAVVEEWLYSYPAKRKRILFERTGSEFKVGGTVVDSKAKLEILEELNRPDRLLLSACDRLALAPLMPVYNWFVQGLTVRTLKSVIRTRVLSDRIGGYLHRKPQNHRRLVSLLGAADVGVTGLVVEDGGEQTMSHVERRAMAEREVRLLHGAESFDLEDESAGTRNWLELLPRVLDALDEGRVLVVDEIDASLHPMLTARLVGLFQNEKTNPSGAQLIFTTHDTSLLGTMLVDEVLQRDQIWFVDKNAEGASELYPLTDFKPRKDQNTERRYLAGSYGAVPVLGDFADAVLDR